MLRDDRVHLVKRQPCFLVLHGSFNPVHREHIDVLRLAQEHLAQRYDVVKGYLAPTSDESVVKKGVRTFKFEHRVKCCEVALEECGELWMHVHRSGPRFRSGWTMVEHLTPELADEFPGIIGLPVSGADTAEKFGYYKWPGVAVGRIGSELEHYRESFHREFHLVKASGKLSSTEAREAIGTQHLASICGERVAKYINKQFDEAEADKIFVTWLCMCCGKSVTDRRWWYCEACWHDWQQPTSCGFPEPCTTTPFRGAAGDLPFVCEGRPTGSNSPLFHPCPTKRTIGMNAGDKRLYVGGKKMNGAFAELLWATQHLNMECDTRGVWRCWGYASLHRAVLQASREKGGCPVSSIEVPQVASLLCELHLEECMGVAGDSFPEDDIGLQSATGCAFLDVFTEDARPLSLDNIAMLYVVGPKGEGCTGPQGQGPLLDKSRFLSAVEALAKRALNLVSTYNQTAKLPVQEVRWALVSGGVYCHAKATKLEVAKATVRGMLAADTAGIQVTFAYDDNAFFSACQETSHRGSMES